MWTVLDSALGLGQKHAADRLAGQASIFDGVGLGEANEERHHPPISSAEFDERELLRLEKETLGLYCLRASTREGQGRAQPQDRLHALGRRATPRRRDRRRGRNRRRRQAADDEAASRWSSRRSRTTGSAEVVVFNSTHAAAREHLETDRMLIVKGRVDHKQAGRVALEVSPFESTPHARSASAYRRSAGPSRPHPRARSARQGLPRRGSRLRRARDVSSASALALGPTTA